MNKWLKKLFPKSSKEVYMEEVYGPNGLFAKYNYILNVIRSCKTHFQLHNCYNWWNKVFRIDVNIKLSSKYRKQYLQLVTDLRKSLYETDEIMEDNLMY